MIKIILLAVGSFLAASTAALALRAQTTSAECQKLGTWAGTIEARLPTAIYCADMNRWRAELSSGAAACRDPGLQARAQTLALELDAKGCIVQGGGPPRLQARPPENLCGGIQHKPPTGNAMADGRTHVESLANYLDACSNAPASCADKTACEQEFVRATIAYLRATSRDGKNTEEALQFLSGVLHSKILQDQGLLAAAARVKDPKRAKEAMVLLAERLEETDVETLKGQLALAELVGDPEELKKLGAALKWLMGENNPRRKELEQLLSSASVSGPAVQGVVAQLEAAQRNAIFLYAGVASQQRRRETRQPGGEAERLLVVYGHDSATTPCDQYFRLALSKALSDTSLGGIREPIVVDENFYTSTVDEAICTCERGSRACSKARIVNPDVHMDIGGRCDGVLNLFVRREGDRLNVDASVHHVGKLATPGGSTPASATASHTTKNELDRLSVDAKCSSQDIDSHRQAALTLLGRAWAEVAAFEELPVREFERTVYREKEQEESEAPTSVAPGRSLFLAGLPHLSDDYSGNDTLGWVWAGSDLVVLGTSLTLGGLAISARNDYSQSHAQGDLDRANRFLGLAVAGAAIVAVLRVASGFQYEYSGVRYEQPR